MTVTIFLWIVLITFMVRWFYDFAFWKGVQYACEKIEKTVSDCEEKRRQRLRDLEKW